ncbi:hypothetical protein [Pseudoruegeria sp. HB172150]|uniref:hypothetical protein n=1 Tax=Pseudoruegeria sp. HB172150 TaxID=2721164 RepID=UPI0015574670|nr:hypothetical protein [Pseudoruegeria sp. HB172150]
MGLDKHRTSIVEIIDDIARKPEDRDELQDLLREKIAELEEMGQTVPDHYLRYAEDMSEDEADALFNNMPV